VDWPINDAVAASIPGGTVRPPLSLAVPILAPARPKCVKH
jgi:hypothetical protein